MISLKFILLIGDPSPPLSPSFAGWDTSSQTFVSLIHGMKYPRSFFNYPIWTVGEPGNKATRPLPTILVYYYSTTIQLWKKLEVDLN